MALDKDGRPIPAYIPPPPNRDPPPDAMLEQFRIMAEKTDSAIRQCADLSLRIVELEKNGGDRLNAGLIDIGKRFDTMMVERIREFERRYETLTATVAAFTEAPAPHFGPEPHHHPPAPVKR